MSDDESTVVIEDEEEECVVRDDSGWDGKYDFEGADDSRDRVSSRRQNGSSTSGKAKEIVIEHREDAFGDDSDDDPCCERACDPSR